MGRETAIPWTDSTWNPIRGCSPMSPGCAHCYALRMANRFSGSGKPYHGLVRSTKQGPRWTGKTRVVMKALKEPLRWREPRRIFVNSMGDLFHEAIAFAHIALVWAAMRLAKRHTFQVLTKRPGRMLEFVENWGEILPNVWLGVSVEDQAWADKRIPELLRTPAALRFVSCEPLLSSVDLRSYFPHEVETGQLSSAFVEGVNWVIVGGESGPGARRMDLEWARSLRDQCRQAGVPFFFKQKGAILAREMGCSARAGGAPGEWPKDLRIQEFPAPAPAPV